MSQNKKMIAIIHKRLGKNKQLFFKPMAFIFIKKKPHKTRVIVKYIYTNGMDSIPENQHDGRKVFNCTFV